MLRRLGRAALDNQRMKWKIFPATQFHDHVGMLEVLNGQPDGTPLLCPEFVLPLLQEFGTGKEIVALNESANEVQALTLLVSKSPGVLETFQPSQAPLGAWLQRAETPIQPLLKTLMEALPGFALAVGITQQDPDLLPRPADGDRIATLDYIQTSRITIEGSFEQYWKARGKNLKHNMKRQRSSLEKDGIKTALEVVTDPKDIRQAVADYGRLESAGWKAQGGTAIHPDNAQGRFYRTMLENFCRKGRGRVYRYRFNDRVVAVDLCIEGNSTLIILKTTHDESIKTCSPAFLMRQESFSKLFDEQRIKRIEFYGKLMDWHTRWSNEVRTMYHVNYYRWPLLSKIRGMLLKLRMPQQKPDTTDFRLLPSDGIP
jgi:CelD/BcsL family acetyltransferase involved in cellulose biosynthesis